jgi:hypothetical protein
MTGVEQRSIQVRPVYGCRSSGNQRRWVLAQDPDFVIDGRSLPRHAPGQPEGLDRARSAGRLLEVGR